MNGQSGNYVRMHRIKAGLTQLELGKVLGYDDEGAVSRHESARSLPPFLIAFGYSVIFRQPVADIFAGLYETVEQVVEDRLRELQGDLEQRTGQHEHASLTRKLEWLAKRLS